MKKLNSILLVDDDEGTNFLHKLVLEEADIAEEIIFALNGEEALEIIKENSKKNKPQPDMIFLDINMPRMNGWEFIEEYQKLENTSNIKLLIIMLTVSLNPDDKEKAQNINSISGFINKPLTVEVLKEIMNDYFNN